MTWVCRSDCILDHGPDYELDHRSWIGSCKIKLKIVQDKPK